MIVCMDETDLQKQTFLLAGKRLKNGREGDYLGLHLTQRGFEENAPTGLMAKGMEGIRELGSTQWFNAGLTIAEKRSLYYTHVRSRISYGVLLCTKCDVTCKALLKLKRAPSERQVERLSIIYRMHSMIEDICKQSSRFVSRLQITKEKGNIDKMKRHAVRSLTALREIGDGIVCGRERLDKKETWENRLERHYDEQRDAEGSNNTTTRKPNRCAQWKDEEWAMTDTRMNARRRNAVDRWFIHRFPISQTVNREHDDNLTELRRWRVLGKGEKADVMAHLDKRLNDDEEDWRTKQREKVETKWRKSS